VVVVRPASGVTRPALLRTAIGGSLATFVSLALLACPVALADTVTTNFEAPLFNACTPPAPVFNALCTVKGQDGWKSAVPGDIPSLPEGYDQQVVVNSGAPAAFGGQSLRLSNGYNQEPGTPENPNPAEFHYQTYSKPTVDAAGESQANTEYIAQFSFISTQPTVQQPGLFVSVSPDDGEGGRMSYVSLEDVPTGIDVVFYDTTADGDFVPYDLGILPRDVPHTIKFWMKLNPGANNDLVRIYVDDRDVGQCFTTWEGFYRSVSQDVPISDTLQFRSTGDQVDQSLLGWGYLFDNVTITTADGPGPPGCDVPIEKQADTPTVTAGGLARYRITVRNRGRATERNLAVCDHIPRWMTFVLADRKLFRLGRRRCFVIPSLRPGQRVSTHLALRVNANAPLGILDNIADITPIEPPPSPSVPPSVPPVLPPAIPPGATRPDVPGKITEIPPLKRVKVIVKIIAKRKAHPPKPPPVTG
jgi:uncharacterized repeat protein (TIGR01451 family)